MIVDASYVIFCNTADVAFQHCVSRLFGLVGCRHSSITSTIRGVQPRGRANVLLTFLTSEVLGYLAICSLSASFGSWVRKGRDSTVRVRAFVLAANRARMS